VTTSLAQCLISFGSNLGRRDASIAHAAQIIATSSLVRNFSASRLFETPPVGGPPGQEPFLNAVAAFETAASARQVLSLLQHAEQQLGRIRQRRWDARSIDLDVVLYGRLVGDAADLIVPHPRYTARQFVLRPACDVAPEYRDPRFGWTIQQLSDHLCAGLPSLALSGGTEAVRRAVIDQLAGRPGLLVAAEPPLPGCLDQPWVSAFLPPLPSLASRHTDSPSLPRLVARLVPSTTFELWPAPHELWPHGRQWPEYRLEVSDIGWAADELAAALVSMRCEVKPVTDDDQWWHNDSMGEWE